MAAQCSSVKSLPMLHLNDCDGKFRLDFRSKPGRSAGSRICELIWGDCLHPTGKKERGHTEVFARGRSKPGWVPTAFTTEHSLLEFYIIDVGQGDGILIRTPDDKWHLIDAGISNSRQMTGKGVSNFIRWKFKSDLCRSAHLSTITMSHPDFDHYGGMLDILSGDLGDSEKLYPISVDTFYHSGMGRFNAADALGQTIEGTIDGFPIGGYRIRKHARFIVELLDGKDSFETPYHPFDGSFADLASLVVDKAQKVKRLGLIDGQLGWFPGYAPDNNVKGPDGKKFSIRLLAPVLEKFEDENGHCQIGLRKFSSYSKTSNGHSILLRFDYGDAKILMTGDLNAESQRLLLSYIDREEFATDVAKGCHHGSEDIDMRFIEAMQARTTVISSGDNEDYAHPRPVVLGACGFFGRQVVRTDDKTIPPLIYSTELARSIQLRPAERVRVDHDNKPSTRYRSYAADRAQVQPKGERYRHFSHTPVSTDLVYGLVNIRSDGSRILCATLEEKGNDFDVKTFWAGRKAEN